MKVQLTAAAFALGLVAASAALAQDPPKDTEAGASLLASATLPAAAKLTVASPAFKNGADIPFENTQWRPGDAFPGLSWSKGPAGTKSYVLVMQDGDAIVRGMPIFHWSVYNIPATATKLDAGVTAPPAGASFGPNIRGVAPQPYLGPKPPKGPKHRYHLQVFALDTTLGPDVNSGYDALTGAMKGHVLAEGEVVGLGSFDTASAK